MKVGEEPTAQEAFHTLVLSGDENEAGVKLTALDDNTEAVVVCDIPQIIATSHLTQLVFQIAGEPLQQEVVQYGPFVMTSRQEIQQTLLDCENTALHGPSPTLTDILLADQFGKNGFEKAHTWKSLIGGR